MSFKERWDKLDDRLKALADKYPLVAAAVLTIGFIAGFVVGKLV